ncbi:hypothetical protein OPQ81_005389 [Rhizoctonia solani]|nr:hypothetical protein OPQ81_005389 [Rhizoctonia solani]
MDSVSQTEASSPGEDCNVMTQAIDGQAGATTPHQSHTPAPGAAAHPMTHAHTRQLWTTYCKECDTLPEPPVPLPYNESSMPTTQVPPPPTQQSCRHFHTTVFTMPKDTFDFCDKLHSLKVIHQPTPKLSNSISDAIAPCPNLSTYYFQDWFWNGNNKLKASRKELQQMILRPDFDAWDLARVNLQALDQALAQAAYEQPEPEGLKKSDGWSPKTVRSSIPLLGKGKAHSPATVPVEGLFSQSMLAGIRKGFMYNNVRQFIYEPYQSFYLPPGTSSSKPQTVIDEIYTSPAMFKAHKKVQELDINDANCMLPHVVAAVMLGSDALQLGDFSKKKAWMLYMWLGNLSKYE